MRRFYFAVGVLIAAALSSARVDAQCAVAHPPCASATVVGPTISCIGPPDICAPLAVLFGIRMTGAGPNQIAVLALGVDSPPISLPSPPLCSPNCQIFFLPFVILQTTTNTSGTAQILFPLPCDPTLLGQTLDAQWVTTAVLAPTLCFVLTPALHVTFF